MRSRVLESHVLGSHVLALHVLGQTAGRFATVFGAKVFRAKVFAAIICGATVLGLGGLIAPRLAEARDGAPAVIRMADANALSDVSAQRRRAPTRLRVYRMPGSYPGPLAVRECRSWYAEEWRASGTVIVPHQRCWWRRG